MRRRLLLLAGILLLAWAVVQFWPFGSTEDPVTTSTVATPGTSPTSVMPSATPVETRTTVKLKGNGRTCDNKDVTLTPSVTSPQPARSPVAIDIAVTASGSKPCTVKAKDFDPIAVIRRDSSDVWDSSVCAKRMLPKEVKVTPGWATTVRSTWTPRKSGKKCKDDEDWLGRGEYTLRIGMLGGEPGKATFRLSKPKPKPEVPKDAKSNTKDKKKSNEKNASDQKPGQAKPSDKSSG